MPNSSVSKADPGLEGTDLFAYKIIPHFISLRKYSFTVLWLILVDSGVNATENLAVTELGKRAGLPNGE